MCQAPGFVVLRRGRYAHVISFWSVERRMHLLGHLTMEHLVKFSICQCGVDTLLLVRKGFVMREEVGLGPAL